MLSVKDYLVLKKISDYLNDKKEEEDRKEWNVLNNQVEKLNEMIKGLNKIIFKLEKE